MTLDLRWRFTWINKDICSKMQLQLLKLQHLVLEVLTRQINGIQLHAQVLTLCMNVVTIQLMI